MKNLGFHSRIIGFAAVGLAASAPMALADPAAVKNGSVSVDVSASQMSRLFVRDDKIVAIRSMSDPNGPQLITQSDSTTGDVYVGFDGDAVGRTYSVFLTTASGEVVQALLHPTNIDPSSVEILEERHKSAQNSAPGVAKSNGYTETIVAFEKVMFNGLPVDGVTYRPVSDQGTDTKHFRIRTVGFYHVDGLTGTVLSITNHSTVPQELTSEQFLVKNVLAAGVTNEIVQPGQEALVYIVEESK